MRAFVVNGESVCTLSELVAENANDQEFCAWAQTAMPGDCYGGGAGGSAECIDIARTAHDIIEAIAADLGLEASALTAEDRRRIRHGLEDGAALAYLGFGDADQDAVEEAHAAMVEIIEDAELSEAPGAPTEVYGGYVWMIGADEFRWSKRATERECRLAVLHAIRLHGVDGAFDLDA